MELLTLKMNLTFFTAPKPFTDPHITLIQRNAIRSWLSQAEQIEVQLIGDEPGISEAASEFGVKHLATVEKNAQGTPLISSIFEQAQAQASSPIIAYINTDIILLDDFLPAVRKVTQQFQSFLIVGQRWDLDQESELDLGAGWIAAMKERLHSEGALHPPAGSDYFAFPRGQFTDLPPFALGRAGWDNWMIFKGRSMRIPVIDATAVITVIHQGHDYGHLEGGVPHYRLPESRENVELGGGPDTVFTLGDATWRLNGQGLRKIPWPAGGLFRWVKSSLVARLGSGRSLRIAHLFF
ncbi:MAG: hypothetical protein ACE5M4_04295, partial [Anaerolineales bacterium]